MPIQLQALHPLGSGDNTGQANAVAFVDQHDFALRHNGVVDQQVERFTSYPIELNHAALRQPHQVFDFDHGPADFNTQRDADVLKHIGVDLFVRDWNICSVRFKGFGHDFSENISDCQGPLRVRFGSQFVRPKFLRARQTQEYHLAENSPDRAF